MVGVVYHVFFLSVGTQGFYRADVDPIVVNSKRDYCFMEV